MNMIRSRGRMQANLLIIAGATALAAGGMSAISAAESDPATTAAPAAVVQYAMPGVDEDVLWVSSVPLGLEVFVVPKQKNQRLPLNPDEDLAQHPEKQIVVMQSPPHDLPGYSAGPFAGKPVGRTPLAVKVTPGWYCVAVQLERLEKTPGTSRTTQAVANQGSLAPFATMSDAFEIYANLGDETIGPGTGTMKGVSPYDHDGNLEAWLLYDQGRLKRVGKTYEVKKEAGKAATVISLFLERGGDIDKAYEQLPAEYALGRRPFLSAEALEMLGVPHDVSSRFLRRLLRGGKAFYYSPQKTVLCALTPMGKDPPGGGTRGGFDIAVSHASDR